MVECPSTIPIAYKKHNTPNVTIRASSKPFLYGEAVRIVSVDTFSNDVTVFDPDWVCIMVPRRYRKGTHFLRLLWGSEIECYMEIGVGPCAKAYVGIIMPPLQAGKDELWMSLRSVQPNAYVQVAVESRIHFKVTTTEEAQFD